MLQNTSVILESATPTTILTVANGYEVAIVSIEINGGDNGGRVQLVKKLGEDTVFTTGTVSILTNDYVCVDSRIFLSAGMSLIAQSDSSGIVVSVSYDNSEV